MAAPIRDRHLHVRGKATGPSSLSWNGDSFLLGPAVRLKVRQPGSGRYRPHLAGAAIVPEGKMRMDMDKTEIEIKRAPDGSRYVRPYLGRNPVTGRPIRPYHSIPDSLPDGKVSAYVTAWLMGRGEAAAIGTSAKFGDLMERHLDFLEKSGYPANSMRTYRLYAGYAASLNGRDAAGIGSADLSRLYQALIADAGLAPSTVIGLHRFLSVFFGHMAQLGIVDGNPADGAWTPRRQAREVQALTDEQAKRLESWLTDAIRTASTDRMRREAMCIYVALETGMRAGEVCGLRRRDWYPGRRALVVSGTVVERSGHAPVRQPRTKGRRSRTVSLDDDAASCVADFYVLDGHRLGIDDPLIQGPRGGWMRPTTASRAFRRVAAMLGLPRSATFHTLRHTHATLLLMNGTDAKTVSERLGHADVATTLRIYGHVMPGRDSEAAETFRRTMDGKGR